MTKLKADFTIHSGWGNHIEWFDIDWEKVNFNRDTLDVYGHMPICPRKGQTLLGEFEKSFILFKFVSVDRKSDPPDMFFAKVKAIKQELK